MLTFNVKCPSCGGILFVTKGEPKSHDDFIGAPCDNCGRKLTNDDVERQAVDVAREALEKILKGAGL